MININLVPEELIKQKKYQFIRRAVKGIPQEVVVGAIGGLLALLIVLNILLQFVIFVQLANVQRLQMSWDRITPEKRQVDEVLSTLNGLRQKTILIDKIKKENQISWAQKLNVISDVVPSGVWLDRFAIDKEFLLIEGKMIPKKGDQLSSVNMFQKSLKASPVFMKGVKSLDVALTERKKVNTVDLGIFAIKGTLGAGN